MNNAADMVPKCKVKLRVHSNTCGTLASCMTINSFVKIALLDPPEDRAWQIHSNFMMSSY